MVALKNRQNHKNSDANRCKHSLGMIFFPPSPVAEVCPEVCL